MKIIAFLFFLLFIFSCNRDFTQFDTKKPEYSILAIHPYEKFPDKYSNLIAQKLKSFYEFDSVIILEPQPMPKSAFVNLIVPRYRADSILHQIDRDKNYDKYDYVLALTEKDISCTKDKEPKSRYKDWGIFGLGQRPGQVCIVSTFRLWSGKVSETKMLDRFVNICSHEIGHNLGLPHCPTKGCIMQDANETIKIIDAEENDLCNSCKEKISH